jgi:putative SOS response-associated peptidase YedK
VIYRLDGAAAAIAAAFGADPGDDPWQGGSVLPGGFAPVVVAGPGGARRLVPRLWGVPPPPRGVAPVTHLRNPDSPFWIGTLRHTEFRCLVPATSIAVSRAGRTQWLTLPDTPLLALAGVWRDAEVPAFAIVTTDGSLGGLGSVPLILPREHWHDWLRAEWGRAQRLITLGASPLALVPAP